MFEVRLNRYAFFTSGFKNGGELGGEFLGGVNGN